MPCVSVIVPCLNEEETIELLLEAIYKQSYPRAEMEVVISDGMSTDRTRERIAAFKNTNPDLEVIVVDNVRKNIPTALNTALAAARGEWIVRLDAHSVPAPDYIERSIDSLKAGLGDNVGGVWQIRPGRGTTIAAAIAAAASHPLGVGDARYRYADSAGPVETVPFGAFRRDLVDRIGFFDENLLTNEDYEFNTRILKAGGRLWLDPQIRSVYFARPDLSSLAKQYWRYGYWKLRMLRKYPESIRWRQALPPLFVASVITLAVLSFFWPAARLLLGLEIGIYAAILFSAALITAIRKHQWSLAFGVTAAIVTMHICWGAGFLWSMVYLIFENKTTDFK